MTLENTDNFVAYRGDTSYKLEVEKLMTTLLDDDLMVVNRAGESYKATGLEIKESIGPQEEPPSLISVTLTEDSPGGDRFDNQSFTSTLNWATKGVPEASVEMKATVTGTLDIVGATDEIVGITDNNYPSMCTGVGYDVYTIDNVFDGDESTGCFADTGTTIVFTPTTPITGKFEILCGGVQENNGQLLINDVSQGLVVNYPSTSWQELRNGVTGPVTSVSWDRNTFVAAIKVDGQLLVSGNTLTLASDANLANGAFKAGDAVKQDNSPIVPVSSEITNVDTTSYSATAVITGDPIDPSYPLSNLFDGDTSTFTRSNGSNSTITFATPLAFTSSLEIFISISLAWTSFQINGVDASFPSVADAWWDFTTFMADNGFTTLDSISSGILGGAYSQSLCAIRIDGTIVEDSQTILTLQDASGLSDFEVGDVVQQNGTTYIATAGPAEVIGDPLLQTSSKIATYTAGVTNSITFTYPQPADFSAINKWSGGSYSVGAGYTIEFTDQNGDVVSGTSTTASSYAVSTLPVSAPALVKSFKITGNDGYAFLGFFNNTENFVATGELATDVSITAIDDTAPSLTTNGGLWSGSDGTGDPSGETFVTGPSTDITATFVSADPSVPSMTVSDVVGPWSSSTGNFVVNTVVNPIMIKPETSAITGVGFAPDYADNAETTKTVLDGSVPQTYSTLDNLFDGDTTTAYNVDYVATGGTNEKVRLTFNTPINYSSSVELFVSSYSTDSTYWASINGGAGQRGGTGVIASGEWVTFGTGPGVLSSIEIGSYNGGNYSSISGIRVDGGMLISGATVLNLTDDTDLNQFATGDAVYAAGVAPASFAPVIYTGNSGTQDISCGFAPDFIWLKDRTGANAHWLYDSVRGLDYYLQSNTAAGQQGGGTSYVSSFNADGFTLEYANATNASGSDYVAWCWSAGNTTVTNNDGTITSLVRSSGDFSIVSYSYGGGGGTWGHGLNDAPSLVIVKNTSSSVDWCVWHEGIAATDYLMLNQANSAQTYNVWQDQAPTSSVVSVSNDSFTGTAGDTYIAYCWAESPTQSFGSYTGNGSTIGPVIDCGFEPAFVLVKCINQASTSWMLWDSARSNDDTLKANDFDAEESIYPIDFLSTGFQLKTNLVNANAGSNTYIYAAFASAGGPSGVVGDITGLDMTLSGSSGVWEVGQKVTMDEKPAASTTANLIFNSTGAVSGLTTADVPGQLVSNKDTPKLTFADGPGTGETWDEELPAGTHLRTSFVATNVEGTTSGTSNEITP